MRRFQGDEPIDAKDLFRPKGPSLKYVTLKRGGVCDREEGVQEYDVTRFQRDGMQSTCFGQSCLKRKKKKIGVWKNGEGGDFIYIHLNQRL